jgi:hypothetical protein
MLETDPMSHRNIIVGVAPISLASHLEWTTQLQFHTVIQIDAAPVYTITEVRVRLASLADTQANSFQLIVTPY